jgi:hypothetical protein
LCIHACISEDRAVFDFLEVCEIIKVDLWRFGRIIKSMV